MTAQPASAGTAPGMIALDRHDLTAVPRSALQPRWTEGDGPLPTFYIGHGFPGLLDDPLWMSELFEWAVSLPKPKGIVIVSAHWEQAPTMITAPAAGTPLVYDFGGFEDRFYRLQYATPDATELGRRIAQTMPDDKPLHQHRMRGLDHGAWVPLRAMYPLADVPVLQISMPTHDPERLMDLGRRLRELRAEGHLVIGSGFMTHGRPSVQLMRADDGTAESWSSDFDLWAGEMLDAGRVDALADFRTQAPGMPYAHPTVEHFTPLFITLGAASSPDEEVRTKVQGFKIGLSKRSIEMS